MVRISLVARGCTGYTRGWLEWEQRISTLRLWRKI